MITKESLRKTYKAVGNKRKQVYKQFIMNRLQEAAEAGECELYLEVVDLTYDLHDYNAYDFQDVIDELEHEGFDVEHDSHPMSYTIKF
jgi:hypothetical protein